MYIFNIIKTIKCNPNEKDIYKIICEKINQANLQKILIDLNEGEKNKKVTRKVKKQKKQHETKKHVTQQTSQLKKTTKSQKTTQKQSKKA